MFRSFFYIYLYISIYTLHSAFFCKRTKCSCVLLNSLQKNVAFFALLYVLCKRTLHSLRSFQFFRKERKRTQHSFGSHKSPKTLKKNGTFFLKNGKERNVPNGKERGAQPWLNITFLNYLDSLKLEFFKF